MRLYLLLLLLLYNTIAFAQRELIHVKDPAALRTEVVGISHFNLPETYGKYAGIRFVDTRYLKGFAGFIQQNLKTGFRKITTAKSFEDELNTAVKIKKDSAVLQDSIIVVLRNFWLFRTGIKEGMNCHVKALFFTKRSDTFFYKGKIDTVFKRHAILRYEFQYLPALFIEDMLASFSFYENRADKFYHQDEFSTIAFQQRKPGIDSPAYNGLYFSFADFIKGKMSSGNFSLNEFYEQYRMAFDTPGETELLSAKIWGCWYNGQLYIKQGKLFSKTFPIEHTFILLDNFKTSPSEGSYSCPMVLNMDSGKLE